MADLADALSGVQNRVVAPLLFWLSLFFPGYALLRRFCAEDLKSGIFGTIALAYLTVFTVLAPISIAGYVLHLPLAVLSIACLVAVAAGLLYITYRRWWGDLIRLTWGGVGIFGLILLANLILAARTGSFLSGDTLTHVARIRYLLDHGFTNSEPYVAPDYFFPPYHTNLLHALHAACAQITRTDPLSEWSVNLVWADLVTFCGFYYLGFSVFERRWVAGLIALFFLARQAPVDFLVYPNKVAPFWLLPLMGGFAVEVFRDGLNWRTPSKLAAGAFVLGQVHGLYAIFAGILVAPALLAVLLARLRAKRPGARWVAVSLLALFAGAPFVLVGKYTMNKGGSPGPSWVESDIAQNHRFYHFENGWHMLRPGPAGRYQALAVGILCALLSDRRKQAGVLIAGAGAAALIAFVPPVCTAGVRLFGPPHTIYRLHALLQIASYALMPGAVAYLLVPLFQSRWTMGLASIIVFFAGMRFATDTRYAWPSYWSRATADLETRTANRRNLQELEAFFAEHIPRGATVLTDQRTAMWLVMLDDCHVIIHERLMQGIRDATQRLADLDTLLDPDTPWPSRRRLLKKYDVKFCLVTAQNQHDFTWLQQLENMPDARITDNWQFGGYVIVKLEVQ